MEVLLGVPVKVSAAGFALKLAAERAGEVIAVTWYPRAHSLVQITGLDGLSSVLGCLGLCLAFFSMACGIAMGSTVAMMKTQARPLLKTGCVGLTVFLGCGIAGAFIGSASTTLMALGLRGLCAAGFVLSLILLFINKQQQTAATPARMLVFSAVVFITMQLGVWSSQFFDSSQPRLSFAIILLLPAAFLIGFLVDKLAFKKPTAFVTLSFMLLVPFTGLLLGLQITKYSRETPLFYETFYAVQSWVYTVELLTGLTGALIGVMSVSFWEADKVEGLSLWISVPAAVVLYNLDVDNQHSNLHSVTEWCLGAGGEFGLISGLAAASGVSLGLVVIRSSNNIAVPLILPLACELLSSPEVDGGTKELQEDALSFAVLGVVMMGAVMLGAAGLLTAGLGSAGIYGVTLAILIIIMTAIKVSYGD